MDKNMIEAVTEGYIEALLFGSIISTEDGEERADEIISPDDITSSDRNAIQTDVACFLEQAKHLFTEKELTTPKIIGYNFYFTRAGHCTGFWDGGYVEGNTLTGIAESFRWDNTDIYLDDGIPHICSS